MQSLPSSEHAVDAFDPSRPFRGLVLCCTSIEADQRSEIAQRTSDMGGIHKYDLTPDVTHLIVGDYNTAKYRHVAKERPDIKPMAAAWVEAVRRLWVEDQEIDFAALESTWQLQTFESSGGIPNSPEPAERQRQKLVCCLTNFEDSNVRAMIEEKVKANGGEYVADLSRQVTHLIVARPEGKKYSAARKWDIHCVTIEWLHDSVERGMILDEECYDPNLPPEDLGKGAWLRRDVRQVSLGKRPREESTMSTEGAKRKLRKSASVKLNRQSSNIWGDILNQSAGDPSRSDDAPRESSAPVAATVTDLATPIADTSATAGRPARPSNDSNWPALRKAVFSDCRFFVHGFPESKEQVIFNYLTSHGGQLSSSLEDVASLRHAEPLDQRYLLVPQASQPDSHPQLPEGVHIITEFFIERCIHNKTLFSPTEHVWGQPFARFPIDGFQDLTICTAGFVNEQLNQIEKTVIQLGATYSEKLHKQVSLLVCPDLGSLREQKRDLAIYHDIPIVSVEWLWQCITTGCSVPWGRFQFEELIQKADAIRANLRRKELDKKKDRESLSRTRSEPVIAKPLAAKPPAARHSGRVPVPPAKAGVDTTAFDNDIPGAHPETSSIRKQEPQESHYETAPSHFDNAFTAAPLAETTASALNKPTSPAKPHQPDQVPERFPTEGEVGDSEAGEDSDATVRTAPKEPPTRDSDGEGSRKVQRAKDFARLELSKRLNSLMANDDAQEGHALHSGSLPRPARRKRQILGRATSNVSAASSASADSASGPRTRQLSSVQAAASVSGLSELDKFLDPAEESHSAETDHLPPSTQLEYEDPEARKKRQVVMGKMMGHNKQGSEGESEKRQLSQRQHVENLRLEAYASKETSAIRRITRRQGRQ